MAKFSVIFAIKMIGVEASHEDQVERLARRKLAKWMISNPISASQSMTMVRMEADRIHGLTADEWIEDEGEIVDDIFNNTQSMDDFNKDIVEGKL